MSRDDIQEVDLSELATNLENDVEEKALQQGILDVKKLMSEQLELSRNLKTMRAQLKAKKFAVDKALLIVERRLEMSLEMIKTLQLPLN